MTESVGGDSAFAEQSFLERSLLDLDAELAAGELTMADYANLKGDYTARLARSLRSGAGTDPAVNLAAPAVPGAGARRRTQWLVVGLIGVFAVAAGFAVARGAGSRSPGDVITGSINAGVRGRLDECLALSSQAEPLEAVRCYTDVLETENANVEAHTYRAWTLIRVGDERVFESAERDLDQAVALDPTYPDARVFRTVLYLGTDRADLARAELAAFDALNAPVAMRDLVEQFGLRERIETALDSDQTS